MISMRKNLRMIKLLTVILTVFLMAVFISSCARSNSLIKSHESSGINYWYLSYEKFNGYKEKEIFLSDNEEYTFSVEIVTNSGTLGANIKDSSGISFFNAKKLPLSSFSFEANGNGEYIIRFNAKNHNGSFRIEWK